MRNLGILITLVVTLLLAPHGIGNSEVDRLQLRKIKIQNDKREQSAPPSPLVGEDLFAKELSGGHIQNAEIQDLLEEFVSNKTPVSFENLTSGTEYQLSQITTHVATSATELFMINYVDSDEDGIIWYTNKLDGADEQKLKSFISVASSIKVENSTFVMNEPIATSQQPCQRVEQEEFRLLAPELCFQIYPFAKSDTDFSNLSLNKESLTQNPNIQIFVTENNGIILSISQLDTVQNVKTRTILTYSQLP